MRVRFIGVLAVALAGNSLLAGELSLRPDRDNSIFSEGARSNALGQGLFFGRTAFSAKRRALLYFDVAEVIPKDAVIDSAWLSVSVTHFPRGGGGDTEVSLHRLESDWEEGASRAIEPGGLGATAVFGDPTWHSAAHDLRAWTHPGGDFAALPTATTVVGRIGEHRWKSPRLTEDVQDFLLRPERNFGWILIGDERFDRTARRIVSREGLEDQPALFIAYHLPSSSRSWEAWVEEFLGVTPDLERLRENPDGDAFVNLAEYAFGLDPRQPDKPSDGFSLTLMESVEGKEWQLEFIRDTRLVHVSYFAESSCDLIHWESLAKSVAGSLTRGISSVTEIPVPNQPFLVKARFRLKTLPVCDYQFFRVRIELDATDTN